MLADQARIPSLGENKSKVDIANNRSVIGSQSKTDSHVQKFRVERTPINKRGLTTNREANPLATNSQAKKDESTSQRLKTVPNANQNMFRSNERSEPLHFHKERNAPEPALGLLESQFLPSHVFNIVGTLPLNKEKPQVSQRINEELSHTEHPLKPTIQATRKTDQIMKKPQGKETVQLKHNVNYALRTSIGTKDRTQTKIRFDI